MVTGLLQNKYICIINKIKDKDLNRISHILIEIVSEIQHYKITSGYWQDGRSLFSIKQ